MSTKIPDSPAPGPTEPEVQPEAPWIRRFPLRSPTLPPATHTNVYLVGDRELLLVDPGTPDQAELSRLVAEVERLRGLGHGLRGIFLTHHHFDHVSGTPFLQERLGVPVYAHPLTAARVETSDIDCEPVEADAVLPIGPQGFRTLHTPGHAPGHLCLVDEASPQLIVGDMVASTGTILVDPDDDGDMAVYMASLRRLLALPNARLWPAHGVSVADGHGLLSYYLAHRDLRERKLLGALAAGPATVKALLPLVYDDVPPAIYPIAEGSLRAHLYKLLDEERAVEDSQGRFYLTAE